MHQEFNFQTRDGMRLYGQSWSPAGEVCARVVLLHGFGDHSARYGFLARKFNEAGIAVHAYDQRGHGRSPGRRAYIARFETLLEDLDAFLAEQSAMLDTGPWFFMGHSMGGMVLARYLETRSTGAAGAIFSSPFLAMKADTPKPLLTIAPLLSALLPWLPVGKVDNVGLSRNPAVVEAANRDPLAFHGLVAARTGHEFIRIINSIREESARITLPILVFHGSSDAVVPPDGSRFLHNAAGSQDKTLNYYEGGYHELWNDLCKEEVMTNVLGWLTSRLITR